MAKWTDNIRECCRNNCAKYGDPPCFELPKWTSDCTEMPEPCEDCIAGRVTPY